MEAENTTEFFYEKLKNSTNPGPLLAAYYCSLYEIPATKDVIIMSNRLIKLFGRFTVFFSILDMFGSYPDKVEKPYPLLFTICRNKFESSHDDIFMQSHGSLDKYIDSIDKGLKNIKRKRLTIPPLEGLDDD